MTLSLLNPVSIADAMLTSSTVAEPAAGETAWNAATSYTVGQRVIRTTTHRIYENLIAGVDATLPENATSATLTTPRWLDYGPTSRWAMFDSVVSTPTTIATPLTVVLHPGQHNAVFLAGLDAEDYTITVKDAPGGAVVFTQSGTLEASMPPDYYEHFFDRFRPLTDLLVTDIPPYNNAEITITLTKGSGNVSCGIVALGDLRPLGATQYGAKAKPKTYSYIGIDDFGNNTIVRRKSAKDMSATAFLAVSEADTVLDAITSVLDVPCVWVGMEGDGYTGLRVFGLGSGEVSYDYPQDCLLNLEVKGLI